VRLLGAIVLFDKWGIELIFGNRNNISFWRVSVIESLHPLLKKSCYMLTDYFFSSFFNGFPI